MTNKLYNLGDSWAWGFEDSFDIPYETTYADIIANNFNLEKVNCCKPGWALGNVTEKFLQTVVPNMQEGDYVFVTIPPDTRITVAIAAGVRDSRTVFSDSSLWRETLRETGASPYHFELILNKDILLIASICKLNKVNYAFQHNYSSFSYDPLWDMSLITDNYVDMDKSMLNILGLPNEIYLGSSLEEQVSKRQDGPKKKSVPNIIDAVGTEKELELTELYNRIMNRSFHPNLEGHRILGEKLTHRLRQIWDMQQTNGIN